MDEERKNRLQLEKTKVSLANELATRNEELKTLTQQRNDAEKRRKAADNQLVDIVERYADMEKAKNEVAAVNAQLQVLLLLLLL